MDAAWVPDFGAPSLGPDALDMIAAVHLDLRAALARAVDPSADRAFAAEVGERLPTLLTLHHADEEGDLFPALLAAAPPDERLEATLERLRGEHAGLKAAAEGAAAALARAAAGQDSPADRAALGSFCALKRRHMAFETAVILPLARARLTPARRLALARRIADRHGVCLLPRAAEAAHA